MPTQKPANQPHVLEVAGLNGLSLYSDPNLRTKDTWQQLDNFDLVVDGSIRKILPPKLISGPFANVLYQLLEYRKAINYLGGALRVVAIDSLGNLWDINGSTSVPYSTSLAAQLNALVDIPFMGQMQGYFIPFTIKTWQANTAYNLNDAVYRYSAADGNLYVYKVSTPGMSGALGAEPKWPAVQGSTIIDKGVGWTNEGILNSQRFKLNYGIVVAHTFPAMKFVEWKYDPTNAAEVPQVTGNRIGVSQPLVPINVSPAVLTPNLNGYNPIAGRAYVWTYYNPNILHDSSPSPFVGPTKITDLDNGGQQKVMAGSILPPLSQPSRGQKFKSYQSAYLELPLVALTPPYGDGYTCIRCWATLDGGSNFFLLATLYDANGNVITNGDGSIPIATLIALQAVSGSTGEVPLPTAQNSVPTTRIYDGGGGPINLAPDPQNLGSGSWTETVGNQIVVVPGDSPSGNAAFEYVGTGVAAPDQKYRTNQIAVQAGATYVFQGYIDNTNGAGGTVAWEILNGVGFGPIAFATGTGKQGDNTAGYVTGTFVAPASGEVAIRAHITGVTVTIDTEITLSDPILQIGAAVSLQPTTYPTPDASLVYPAPAPESQNPPPPNCLCGTIFADVLFLVDHNDPLRLWYCNTGDFNSYGVNAYIDFPSDRTPSIIELIAAYDRLLVSSARTMFQVTSQSPAGGFADQPFDPQHGSLSYRGSIPYASGVLSLLEQGIASLNLTAGFTTVTSGGTQIQTGFTPEAIISRPIKPLLDSIDPATVHVDSGFPGEPLPAIDNFQDLYLLGFRVNPASPYMDTLIAMPLRGSGQGQFSRLPTLPGDGQVTALKEAQLLATRKYGVLALTGDKSVYQLFAGTQDGSLTATAVTQPLPTKTDIEKEWWDTDKAFQELFIEGTDLPNFVITASTDGGVSFPFGPWSVVSAQNLIQLGAIEGKQLTLKFAHSAETALTPALAAFSLRYDIIGQRP